jgi:uracil-DNA glycosylase family 4
MPNSENSQRLIQQLTTYLEIKREAGLLPGYIWKKVDNKKQITSNMTPHASPLTPHQSPTTLLQILREKIGDCTRCRLCQGRTHLVYGVGNPNAELMFVGEGPGRDEDLQGEPFVGRAGQLLTKIIEAMKLKRSDVYIANVVKCRPPENRTPAPDEIATCSPFLLEQIEIIQPKVIVCLGSVATQTLLSTEQSMGALRGRLNLWPSRLLKEIHHSKIPEESIKLMPTYHPAYLLRNPNMKKVVWEDMKIVMGELEKNKKN